MNDAARNLNLLPRALGRLGNLGVSGVRALPDIDAAETAARLRSRVSAPDRFDFALMGKLAPGLRVSVERIENAGYLLDYGDEAEIVLRATDGHRRQRFTFGHELGHWLSATSHDGRASVEVESWCDRFAAHLLVPPSAVQWSSHSTLHERLISVVEAPARFDVSVPTAFRQVSEVNRATLLHVSPERRPGVFGRSSVSAALVRELVAATAREPGPVLVSSTTQRAVGVRLRGSREVVAVIEKRS